MDAELHERDFYTWTRVQADALPARPNAATPAHRLPCMLDELLDEDADLTPLLAPLAPPPE